VTRRTALAGVLAALAMLGAPAAAHGQGAVVQAADGDPNPLNYRWLPENVTIKAGESVTWRFEGASGSHNVMSQGGNWSYYSGPFQPGHPPVTLPFSTPGEYQFACEVHASTMFGKVIVTDASGTPPPPPPPPPLSEQPWANDQPAPSTFEVADTRRPQLSRVRTRAVRNGARVRFRLSERARVTVRFKLAGITVEARSRTFRAGAHRLTVRDRWMHGRYRIEVFARDLAGNRSRVERDRVTVR
jgi:plastocyanin